MCQLVYSTLVIWWYSNITIDWLNWNNILKWIETISYTLGPNFITFFWTYIAWFFWKLWKCQCDFKGSPQSVTNFACDTRCTSFGFLSKLARSLKPFPHFMHAYLGWDISLCCWSCCNVQQISEKMLQFVFKCLECLTKLGLLWKD